MSIEGNRATKVSSGLLQKDESNALYSKEGFIYYNMLGECEVKLKTMVLKENITKTEYDVLHNMHCLKYEKLFYEAMRAKKREQIHDDQIKDFSTNYLGLYHPYNPYLQKYQGGYLRTYQLFD